MCIGIVGIGRMGKVLAARLADYNTVRIYDRNPERVSLIAEAVGAMTAASLEEIAQCGTVILAVPDREVISCIKDFNLMKKDMVVINVATNVSQQVLENTAAPQVRCIGVKFVGHAGEMALGLDPVVIVNERPKDLAPIVQEIFSPVGHTIIGRADVVTDINTTAAEKALEAAVRIEDALRYQGIADPEIIKSAIRQVAAGILKAFADDDLGPFAREIVRAVKAKMNKTTQA